MQFVNSILHNLHEKSRIYKGRGIHSNQESVLTNVYFVLLLDIWHCVECHRLLWVL
jgi:hypothetical protein